MTYAKNDFSIPQFIEIDDKTDRGSIFSRNGSGEYTMEGYYVFIPSKKYPVIYKKECIGLVEIEDCQMSYYDKTGTTSIFYHVVQISQEDANAFTFSAAAWMESVMTCSRKTKAVRRFSISMLFRLLFSILRFSDSVFSANTVSSFAISSQADFLFASAAASASFKTVSAVFCASSTMTSRNSIEPKLSFFSTDYRL